MRRLVFLMVVVGIATAAGCTVTKTDEEVATTIRQSVDLDMRQIVEDWNYIWLVDRQYRLTKWHTR